MKRLLLLTSVAVLSIVSTSSAFADEWVPCARENQNCTVRGTKVVRYGAGHRWTDKVVTHKTYCGNEVFGDPAPGVKKACYYLEAARSPRWEKCANEGHTCQFHGRANIRYGADGRWTQRSGRDGIRCENRVFGDPAPGTKKACYIMVE